MVKIPIGTSESGKSFIKYADGTMIQWGHENIMEPAHMKRVTFQHNFIDTPSITVTPKWVFEDTVYVATGNIGIDGADIYLKGVTYGITKNRAFMWIAIGRWK